MRWRAVPPQPILPAGQEVLLSVAGPEPGTVMPNVVGRHRADAIARLQALGATISIIELEDPRPDPNIDIGSGGVWAQAPGPDEPYSSTVTIWVMP